MAAIRGRKPKPSALKRKQGNPGRRKLPKEPRQSPAEVIQMQSPDSVPFVKLTEMARLAYDLVRQSLQSLNFVRSSDESLLLRYADMMAQYWNASVYIAANGSTYDCPMTNGGTMRRTRPEFLQMMMAAKRLETMEDRLGLSPVARQQYLQRMMAAGAQGNLPGMIEQQGDGTGHAPPIPPTRTEDRPATGFVRRDALN